MKPNRLLLSIALATGLAACSKKEELPECLGSCTVVTGRLLTSGSAPLPNATVTLWWVGGTPNTPIGRKKAVATTDADGWYRVSSLLTDAEIASGFIEVIFSPDKSKYFPIGEPTIAFYHPKRDTIYSARDYLLPRRAAVKFVVPNASQLPTPVTYSISLTSCYGENTTFSQNSMMSGSSTGFSSDTSPYTIDTFADQPVLLKLQKNNVPITPGEILIIPAGTTLTYTLR